MKNLEIDPNKCYILAGDISASMASVDPKCGGNSRYDYMLEKFQQFIKKSEDFDPHGPTVMLFGEKVTVYPETNLEVVKSKLTNINFEGFTNTDKLIDQAYEKHKEEKREYAADKKFHPGTILLIFTDGAATNRLAVERSIIRIANEIDREDEFTITFLTVGQRDHSLNQFLENLHENIEKQLKQDFDIVHVEELEKVDFMGAVAGRLSHN